MEQHGSSGSIRLLELGCVELWSFQQGSQRPDLVHLGTEFCPDPVGSIGDYSKDFNQKSHVIRFIFQKNHRGNGIY